MVIWDYVVLIVYFIAMAAIGLWTMWKIKRQEDYFIGGRGFGKIFQTFAAFGAGTGSGDPVAVAKNTFVSGMSGIWAIMSWLFATPFYWITGVWYRRMRLVTLGDWFVERYQSTGLGAVYTIFALTFYIFYSAFLFTAVGAFAVPLLGETMQIFGSDIKTVNIVIPLIAGIVIFYGMLGGLIAAYWTDLIQGLCIILLSVILIPFGLHALVETFGNPETQSLMDGFKIMHERVPDAMFSIVGASGASEFPVYRIAALALLCLVSVIVQPHMIATGGGSAKKELDARIGLVTGNFFKRLCTIGWALTALIILALMAGDVRLQENPDQAWGFASLRLFAGFPGLTGLMLACLLAALMSSVSCYMVVGSALLVQNIYKPFINKETTEEQGLLAGRLAGLIIVVGAVVVSLVVRDVFRLFLMAIEIPVLFGGIFLIGMFWRRATKAAAWTTFGVATFLFFICPWLVPAVFPSMKSDAGWTAYSPSVMMVTTRKATGTDVDQREAERQIWETKFNNMKKEGQGTADIMVALGEKPSKLVQGEKFGDEFPRRAKVGFKPIFFSDKNVAAFEAGSDESGDRKRAKAVEVSTVDVDENTKEVTLAYPEGTEFEVSGYLNTSLLLYRWVGIDLTAKSPAMLATLAAFPKIFLPFLVMIVVSLFTTPGRQRDLDRYYVKMKTPVEPDPKLDEEELRMSYANPTRFDDKKLLPGTSFEIQKPTLADAVGFVVCFGICFLIIGLAILVANFQGF